jgi:hypothetical protein
MTHCRRRGHASRSRLPVRTLQGGGTTGATTFARTADHRSGHCGQVSQDFRGAVVYELESYRSAPVKAEVIFEH